MDILMISLIPLSVFLLLLLGLAAFWRWRTPTDKAWVIAIALSGFSFVMCGYLIYRFGWDETSLPLLLGSAAIVVVSALVTKFVAGAFQRGTGHVVDSPTWANVKEGAIFLVPGAILLAAGIIWVLYTSLR